MPTLGVPWWRRPRGGGPETLVVTVTIPGGKPASFEAVRSPPQDHANGIRVYVCELPHAIFYHLPYSHVVSEPEVPGMAELSFIEADREK